MRMARVSPARGEERGTGRPGRTGPQRAAPPPLMLRSAWSRGAARPSRARPAARTSAAIAVTPGGGAAASPARPVPVCGRREAEGLMGDVALTVEGRRGAIG